jgi:RNA polymerase sigma-70 factor (ECF subfamily)
MQDHNKDLVNQESKDQLKELVKQSSRGNKDAFHKLYLVLHKPVFSFIAYRAKTREDAKDITQDLFLDVWVGLPKFRYISEKKFYAFVFLIAKRKLARHYDRKETAELNETMSPDLAEYKTPDDILFNGAVKKLSSMYREVIELRYFSQLSFADIARFLKEKETTVKVRHHRAIKQLRNLLQDYEN